MTLAPGLPVLADEAILAQFLETTDLGFEEVGGLLEQARVVLNLAHEMSAEFAALYPNWVLLDKYYRGDPPLPTDPQRLTKKYRALHEMSRSNWMGLVVDVVNERLQISSIHSTSDPVHDKTAWKWWNANNMDGLSPQIHSAALKFGLAYVSVWPGTNGIPKIMGESPMNCHVRYDADTGLPVAALRVWQDNVNGCVNADLITDNYVYRLGTGDVELEQMPYGDWKAQQTKTITVDLSDVSWHFRADVPPVARNPQHEVPYTRMMTEPDLIGGYRSEIAGLIPIQDRINKTNFDRLLAQAFASFPRAWITGIDIPTDSNGKPKEPFDAAVDRLWTIENENAKIGQLDAAELDGYIRANTADVQALATQSRTPPHYLISGMGMFPSGESVRATEYGLSRKCQSRQQSYGDGWSDILRRCGKVANSKRLANDLGLGVVWADVEARSEGETVDALIKMGTLGVPWPALWQRWGASTEEIAAWEKLLEQNAALAQAQQLAQASQKPLMRQLATQAPQISTAGDLTDSNPLT